MVLEELKKPLILKEIPKPTPKEDEVLIKVLACAICRTDLHIMDGELPHPKLPLILGHQIVGIDESSGQKVGIPWLGGTCHHCSYCHAGKENLCDTPIFTGYTRNGGFAEYVTAKREYVFTLPQGYSDAEAAPLLCSGMIGYRSLRMAQEAQKIGFYGFGASAHLLIQIARFQRKEIFAFTRPHDTHSQEEARKMGAVWAGGSDTPCPEKLDAAILFAPVGALVPTALKAVRKGGVVICAEIHMSDIPSFPYEILWGERVLRSVANLTREDGEELLALAPKVPIKTSVTTYPLKKANEAIRDLRDGKIAGSAVLIP